MRLIFGGILSCEKVALALRGALGGQTPQKPIVVRMAGKDAVSGLQSLRDLGVDDLHIVSDLRAAINVIYGLEPGRDARPGSRP